MLSPSLYRKLLSEDAPFIEMEVASDVVTRWNTKAGDTRGSFN